MGASVPREENQPNKSRYSIAHLLALTAMSAICIALFVQGVRPQSSLWGFGVPAGMVVMIGMILFGGAKLSSRPGSIWRIVAGALAAVLLMVIYVVSGSHGYASRFVFAVLAGSAVMIGTIVFGNARERSIVLAIVLIVSILAFLLP